MFGFIPLLQQTTVRKALLPVVLIFNVVVICLLVLALAADRQQREHDADISLENFSSLLDQNISGFVGLIDLSLTSMTQILERQLRAQGNLDSLDLKQIVKEQEGLLADTVIVRVADAAGWVLLGGQSSLQDRDYFMSHRDQPDRGLIVTDPLFGRLSNIWLVTLSRRYNYPDGNFAGVVAAAIPITHFDKLLAGLDLGANGVALLRDSKSGLITRQPQVDGPSGQIGSKIFSAELAAIIASGVSVKTYHAMQAGEGVERTLIYRRMSAVPFHLIIGRSSDDYLAPWRGNVRKGILLGAIFAIFSGAVAWMLWRSLKIAERSSLRNRRLSQLYSALSHCNQAIIYAPHQENLFPLICRAAVEYGGMSCAWIGLLSEEEQCIKPAAIYGDPLLLADHNAISLRLGDPHFCAPIRAAISENQPYWCQNLIVDPDLLNCPGFQATGSYAAYAVLPLRQNGKPVGSLMLFADHTHAFDADSQKLFIEMSNDIGFALTNFDRDLRRKKAEEEQAAAEWALHRAYDFRKQMVDSLPGVFYVFDSTGHFLSWNYNFEVVTGRSAEEIDQSHVLDFFDADDHIKVGAAISWVEENGQAEVEAHLNAKDGTRTPYYFTGQRILADGQRLVVGLGIDVSALKDAEARINELAFYDQLTGLANRTLLIDRLGQSLAASSRSATYGALLFIDLDNFKKINDTLGHGVGDVLLKMVAKRLGDSVRMGDTVARFGGDEFVLVLQGLEKSESEAALYAEAVAEKILAVLDQPYLLNEVAHRCTPSVGVTMFCGNGVPIADLLRQADLAMYKAKNAGRNTIRFFDPDLEAAALARAAMEQDMVAALRDGQFKLHYQPQLRDGERITGAEALVRWQHPLHGLVQPGEFIALAEETGLILPLGQWVLESACAQLALWARRPKLAHLTISVNVSARQFRDASFVEKVVAMITKYKVKPERLKLELTESMLVVNVDDIIKKMTELKSVGTNFSLDDFGTGYSSLSYLRRLPLEQLKIDQSFVEKSIEDQTAAAITKTIIALAQALGLDVIAEGVETREQQELLAGLGCHHFQGFLLSRPLPVMEFEAFVKKFKGKI